MNKYDYSQFDMSGMIRWYTEKDFALLTPSVLAPMQYEVTFENAFGIDLFILNGILLHFPINALQRSTLKQIIFKPPMWFKQGMDPENPEITAELSEAISPTHFVPGYSDGSRLKTYGESDIWIFDVPEGLCSLCVEQIIKSQTLVHELAETILDPVFHSENYKFQMPNRQTVLGLDYFHDFIRIAEKYSTISEYASVDRDEKGKFKIHPESKVGVCCSEEMAETIAAFILKFAYVGNGQGDLDPFAKRKDLEIWVKNFLDAQIFK